MNIVSPRLSLVLPMTAVPPAQPPLPYLRHGRGSIVTPHAYPVAPRRDPTAEGPALLNPLLITQQTAQLINTTNKL